MPKCLFYLIQNKNKTSEKSAWLKFRESHVGAAYIYCPLFCLRGYDSLDVTITRYRIWSRDLNSKEYSCLIFWGNCPPSTGLCETKWCVTVCVWLGSAPSDANHTQVSRLVAILQDFEFQKIDEETDVQIYLFGFL